MGKQEDKEGVGVECLERGKFVTGNDDFSGAHWAVVIGGKLSVAARCSQGAAPNLSDCSMDTTHLTPSRAQHVATQALLLSAAGEEQLYVV